MKIVEKEAILKVRDLLAKKLTIENQSLCFCGSAQKYEDCCKNKSAENLFFLEKSIEKLEAYRHSQGGSINGIPQGLWKDAEKSSIRRLKCIYPNCGQKTANCHLIPECILRHRFSEKPTTYVKKDDLQDFQFEATDFDKAGTQKVFCPTHDGKLFKKIDTLNFNFGEDVTNFLFIFKTLAFHLRSVQYLLGINSQIELIRPVLISRKLEPGSYQINITKLQQQYLHFVNIYEEYLYMVKLLEEKKITNILHLHRDLNYEGIIFFGGLLNISHDLECNEIGNHGSTNITCNILTLDKRIDILFGCPSLKNQTMYKIFFKQLEQLDNTSLVNVANNFLTLQSEGIILPNDYCTNDKVRRKIKNLKKYAYDCMRGVDKFDLKDGSKSLKFIK